MTNVVRLFDAHHTRASQPRAIFDQAWESIPQTMRTRSEGRDHPQLRKAWKLAAFQCGSEERLLGCLQRYLREDKDLTRTGGSGLGVWLRAGKWMHWTPIEDVAADPVGQLRAPAGYRDRFVTIFGEPFVRSWIDQCEWRDGKLWAPRKFTVDKLRTTFSAYDVRVRVELDGPAG